MYKKLRGKITEVFDTQKNFAAAMDMDYAVVNQRLSGTTQWKAPEIAKACEDAGADGISLINTLLGMRINLRTGEPIISIKKGGYSGPGIYPVALRMIYEVSQVVNLPIIGMGGVATAYDVIEMMYAGASLVMIGAQNLIDPYACKKIIEDLPKVMKEYNIENLESIIRRN